ncbi:helicase RepA family protein [Nitrincola schmidtii]|uniref:helicase RepA family protein n=1 Tax=Nitrincola schmidtii TaxID=1730894 RepID=UPI001456A98F|nr:helicase RepA family protein [Nitrincola schmidtii]
MTDLSDFDAITKDLEKIEALQGKRCFPVMCGWQGYDKPQRWLIKGVLPENSLAAIYGASGSFKSFLAISMSAHIATGKTWDGRKTAKGVVLYVVGEGGVGVPQRIKAWALKHNDDTDPKLLFRIDHPVFPADPAQVAMLKATCEQLARETGEPIKLIVFDTLARCYGGADENSAKDMGAFIRGCDDVKAHTGATVLLIHHSGKNEEAGARGSSALRGALDAELLVKREQGTKALNVLCTKQKDSEPFQEVAFDLQPRQVLIDEDGDPVYSLILMDESRTPSPERPDGKALSSNQQSIYQAVRSRMARQEPTSKEVIRDDFKAQGLDIKNFSRTLTQLLERGVLVEIDGKLLTNIKSEEESEE